VLVAGCAVCWPHCCDALTSRRREPGVLVELGTVQQRYRAVLGSWTRAFRWPRWRAGAGWRGRRCMGGCAGMPRMAGGPVTAASLVPALDARGGGGADCRDAAGASGVGPVADWVGAGAGELRRLTAHDQPCYADNDPLLVRALLDYSPTANKLAPRPSRSSTARCFRAGHGAAPGGLLPEA
jgi:hypothetical protein